MGADRLQADHAVVRLAGHDADEAAGVAGFHGERAAVGLEGEDGADRIVAGGLGFLGQQARRDDLRLGEADRGDGDGIEGAVLTGDHLDGDVGLGGGLVLQHRLADQVADRVDAAHRGLHPVVDLHEGAGHVDAHLLQAPAFGAGLTADRDQQLVGGDAQGLAALVDDQFALFPAGRPGRQMQGDAGLFQPGLHRLGQRLVVERQDAVERLDDGDLAAELAER